MNKIKLKILTIAIQLFGGKMLTDIRKFLGGWKTYLSMTAAIIAAVIAWQEGTISLGEFITAITAAIGIITTKAGLTRTIKNGK